MQDPGCCNSDQIRVIFLNAREGVEKRELSYTASGMPTGTATMENSMKVPLKTKNRVTILTCNPTPGHITRENSNLKRYMHPNVHSSTIYNSQGTEAT